MVIASHPDGWKLIGAGLYGLYSAELCGRKALRDFLVSTCWKLSKIKGLSGVE